MLRHLLVAVFASAALAACSGGPAVDPAAAKACALLASAENDLNEAVHGWIEDGRPKGGSPLVRAARDGFLSVVTDAAAAAPADLAPKFSDLKRAAVVHAASGFSEDSGVALELQKSATIKACESAGVDMQITDPKTGAKG